MTLLQWRTWSGSAAPAGRLGCAGATSSARPRSRRPNRDVDMAVAREKVWRLLRRRRAD